MLDTTYLYRVVALFRSEAETGGMLGRRGGRAAPEMRTRAEAKAIAERDRLNEWAASA